MPIVLVFFMGIANFALHRAVLSQRNSLLADAPWLASRKAGLVTLSIEFSVLLAAMALAFGERSWAVAAYAIYTLANAGAAWFILRRGP